MITHTGSLQRTGIFPGRQLRVGGEQKERRKRKTLEDLHSIPVSADDYCDLRQDVSVLALPGLQICWHWDQPFLHLSPASGIVCSDLKA